VLQVRECAPTPFPFVVFTFGLIIESIKEFGVHQSIKTLEEEPGNLKGGKDSFKKEVGGETCIKIDFIINKFCCVGS
jgi:hypothetical protein